MVLTITVQNAGPDPIDNVRVKAFPSEWSPVPCVTILEDNLVRIENRDENLVLLKAGTIVLLDNADDNIRIPKNTEVIGLVGSYFFREESVTDNQENFWLYTENATMEFRNENTVDIVDNENIAVVGYVSVVLDNGLVRLAQDTLAVRAGDNNVWFPADTTVEVVAPCDGATKADENVTLQRIVTITPVESENIKLRLIGSAKIKFADHPYTGWVVEISDENVTLHEENQLAVPADTKVILLAGTSVTIAENTQVICPAENKATVENTDYLENTPKNWTQDNQATYIEWVGISDNQIATGGSLDFPFAVTTPDENKTFTLYVKTTDNKNVSKISEIKVVVDNILPTVTITASPEWVKDNVEVTITVTASETLARLDNVLVAENNATENTAATFVSVSDDNKVWTWTYTTGDNENQDGAANIYVLAADFEDLVGNEGTAATDNFNVDRLAPPTPALDQISGFPENLLARPGIQTNVGEWLLENNAIDNYRNEIVTENDPVEGMTVRVRVGDTVVPVTTGTNGYWYYELALTEGTQELGIQFVDRAGNESSENAENITYDATAPSITWGTITGMGYTKDLEDGVRINDNAPKITLTIRDAVLGIDNSGCNCENDNTGYTVKILNSDLTENENLTNALVHDNHVLQFENTLATALVDNTYYVNVLTGDNLQTENVLVKFVIDTLKPSAPLVDLAYAIESTVNTPVVVKSASRTIGGTAEAGATITIYGTVDTTESVLGTDNAGSDNKWIVTFELTAGSKTNIEVSATDEAGNEGSRTPYGWMLADATAPAVTINKAEIPATTGKGSFVITGSVSKDSWESYADINVIVSPATAALSYDTTTGEFSASIPLSEGLNLIAITATDGAGNSGTDSTSIERTAVSPWTTYAAMIIVIIALLLAAIAIFRKR